MMLGLGKIKDILDAEQERWPLWAVVLFGLGIGGYFCFYQEPDFGVVSSIFVLFLGTALFWKKGRFFFGILTLVCFGCVWIQLKTLIVSKNLDLGIDKVDYVQGQILRVEYNMKGKQRLVLQNVQDFDGRSYLGNFKFTLRGKYENLKAGDCVELVARIMPLPKPSIVGGYQFDRKSFYGGIAGNGYALSSVNQISCPFKPSLKNKFLWKIDFLRKNIVERIKSVLPPDEAAIVAAIMAGDRSLISQELTNSYRNSGLAHFLSISGVHMSMLAGLMFFFVRLLLALVPKISLNYDTKKIAAFSSLLLSAFYLLISGAEVPTQRAFLMTMVVLLGVLFDRRAISVRTICFAAFFVLLLSPEALIGASFQMSFAAVLCLIAFYEKYASVLHRYLNGDGQTQQSRLLWFVKVVWAYLLGIVITDFVASLATLPFAIYHFNQISIYTTVGNFLSGPIIGLIIMPFMLLSLLLMPLGLDVYLLKIVGWGVFCVNEITREVSSWNGAGFRVLSMPLWGFLLIVCGGLWLCLWQKKWRLWGALAIAFGGISLFVVKTPDVLINADADLFAVKDNFGNLLILPSRGNNFEKQIWLEKTLSRKLDKKENSLLRKIYQGKKKDKSWVDLECNQENCLYRGRIKYVKKKGLEIDGKKFDVSSALGASFYFYGKDIKVKTIRDFIGFRAWNKSFSP